jgi:hypothetical protein
MEEAMIDDTELDRLLERSAPPLDQDASTRAAREVHVEHRGARPARRGRRRAATLVLVAGGAIGVGATAAAVDGASLATHLGWRADNAVNHTASDGNECHLGFRAIPEAGMVHGPRTPADDPSVLAAQAYLRTLDLDALDTGATEATLRREYEHGTHQGPGAAPDYTDAFFENQAIFVAMVDAVTDELARQGLVVDGKVTFEGANECTDEVLRR